ncbi:MAG: hypothetical protein KDC38_17085, partial [Planctomycetes bacterium]|nr:hypothetical protein [Planctomycetota bacterium]
MIEDATIESLSTGPVRILMDNPSGPVEGFSMAIEHDGAALSLEGISLDGTETEAVGAEFVQFELDPVGGAGGTLAVLLDFETPLLGQTIAPGAAIPIANFEYRALADLVPGVDPDEITTLQFVDGVLGFPPFENVMLVLGVSPGVHPDLVSGTVTVVPLPEVTPTDVTFYVGGSTLELGPDGLPTTAAPLVLRGGQTEVCFYYTSAFNVQGFQLAICYDCELQIGAVSIEDTIVDEIGAEFVNFQIDSDPFDGDGCELIIGILLDALPPFDGQTLPPTDIPLQIACVDVTVVDEPICEPDPGAVYGGVEFFCGPAEMDLGADGRPLDQSIYGEPGGPVDICFYYTSDLPVQGFQLAVCYDCALTVSTFGIDGSIVEDVGA